MIHPRSRAVGLVAAAVVVVAVAATVPEAFAPLYLLASAAAAAAPWVALRWRQPPERGPWRAIGVGLALVFLGSLSHVVISPWILPASSSAFSLSDAFYVLAYGPLLVGVLGLTRRQRLDHDTDLILDAAAVALGAVAVVVPFIVVPVLRSGVSSLEAVVNTIYPVGDAVLFGAVLRMVLTGRGRTPAGLLVAAGLTTTLAADLAYLASPELDGQGGPEVVSLAWLVSAILIASGTLHPSMRTLLAGSPSEAPSGRARIIASLLSLAGVPFVFVIAGENARDAGGAFWAVTVTALATLVAWRVLRLFSSTERAEADLARTVRYFRALAANSSDALLAVDLEGRIADGSPGLNALLGRDDVAVVGERIWARVHPDDVAESERRFATALDHPGQIVEGEVRIVDFAGCERVLSTRMVNLMDDPDVRRVILNIDDLTARRAAEDALERQANSDALTGLENRVALRRRLRDLAVPGRSGSRPYSLLLVDLDGFTRVNERLGHDAGDVLLTGVADRLQALTRSTDTVARIGGDEFAILLEHHRAGPEESMSFADRILSMLRVPVEVDGDPVVVSASIGIAVRAGGGDHELVLRDAVVAVHEAKAAGRGCAVVFEESMREAAADRIRLESDLVGALERGELALHYQPIVELSSARVTGFEALLRWSHPTLGPISPDRFIPVAVANGLIVPIGAWVVGAACTALGEWRRSYGSDLHVAVNVSARQFADAGFVDVVRRAVRAAGLPPSALTIEITESDLVDDPVATARQLRELKDLGVRIAIDDFGTGYSSLSYLRQFPVDVLKIDRSFVCSIDGSGTAPPIVRGVLELARTLGLATVAEGVEEEAQRELLCSLACELGQGYLFARPMPREDVAAFLAPMGREHGTSAHEAVERSGAAPIDDVRPRLG